MDVNSEINRSSPEVGIEREPLRVLPEVDLSLLSNQEKLLNSSPEAFEKKSESSAVVDTPQPILITTDQQTQLANDSRLTSSGEDTSIQAADSDRIEQEWIDRVKNILTSTIGAPHEREEKIKDLQSDYIFKRYGRKIGQQEVSL